MRIASLALALAIAASPLVANAQQSVKADEQIVIKQVQTDRRAVLTANLGLTEAESRVFWPIYDQYELEMKKVTDQRLAMLDQYAAKYETLTDADADGLLNTRYKLDEQATSIKVKYAKKVQKALPSVKALRYVQLQDRIDNIIAGELLSLIPIAHSPGQ
jgi:vacuolar-type H+-ATPase subunit I/STV1